MSKRYPKTDTVNLVTANIEYSYTFPVGTKGFLLQTRDGTAFKYAYNSGDLASGKYITAHQGVSKSEDGNGSETTTTVYFSAAEDGIVMECEYWL